MSFSLMTQPPLPILLNDPTTSVALVGATDNPMKYGSTIYRNLKAKKIPVYAVNPNRRSVIDVAYRSLADLPNRPTIVNLVVPPKIGLGVLREIAELGYDNVWFQPGAESAETIALAEELGLSYIAHACTMVVGRTRTHA
ncbi:hypothetical protein BMS3Bbin02_01762 [bacterium BMS3Bbin02]|nr:hypothetical protein BMS3Bbin02_01762 [bacterium BMS3Bbin02]